MVLRTSVTYNTQKSTLPLTESSARQADQLGRDAQQASQAGQYGEALRDYYQGLAVMRGASWTPALEVASSLQGSRGSRHRGARTASHGHPFASVQQAANGGRAPERRGVPGSGGKKGAPQSLSSPVAVDPAALPFASRATCRNGGGRLPLEVRLSPGLARAAFVKPVPVHVEALSDAVQQLHGRLAKAREENGSAFATAEYSLTLYERADAGDINPDARRIGAASLPPRMPSSTRLEAGRDPFAPRAAICGKPIAPQWTTRCSLIASSSPSPYDGSQTVAAGGGAARHGRRREHHLRSATAAR